MRFNTDIVMWIWIVITYEPPPVSHSFPYSPSTLMFFFLDPDSAWERKHGVCLSESSFTPLSSIFLQTNDFILLYGWIILRHVYISQFLYLLTHWGHLDWFCILALVSSASLNMHLQGSLLHADFYSSWYMWYICEEWTSCVVDTLPYLCSSQRPGSCHLLLSLVLFS